MNEPLRYESEQAAMVALRQQTNERDELERFIERATPDPLPSSLERYGSSWIDVAIDWLDQPTGTYEMRSGVKLSTVTRNALAELASHRRAMNALRAIADTRILPDTDHAQLTALFVTVARNTIALMEAR